MNHRLDVTREGEQFQLLAEGTILQGFHQIIIY